MENLPQYVHVVFWFTTLFTVYLFAKATKQPTLVATVLIAWLGLQGFIALKDFYLVTDTLPPRFLLAVFPAILTIVVFFLVRNGRKWIDTLNPATLTLLHIVRVPVELVLFWLFLHRSVPQLMTFEGRNFDIISGITAPLVFYFGYIKKVLGKGVLLLWNFICLALLFNIVIHAALSAPSPFQQMAFDQPNIAVLHFPFIWLPCCIVPLVLFSHLICIRHLLQQGAPGNLR
jgi:hypothetical protein